jgi:hypothetical protein
MDIVTKGGKPVTAETLDRWAEAFERGEWPEGKTIPVGRPRLSTQPHSTRRLRSAIPLAAGVARARRWMCRRMCRWRALCLTRAFALRSMKRSWGSNDRFDRRGGAVGGAVGSVGRLTAVWGGRRHD